MMLRDIIEAAERIFNLNEGDIRSRKRHRHINEARDAVCLVAYAGKYSYPRIGRELGGRSRTAIRASCITARGLRDTDEHYGKIISYLIETFTNK